MDEFNERIEAFKKAKSTDELVEMIEEFLDETGLDEEARRRADKLEKIAELTFTLVQHYVLLVAYLDQPQSPRTHWLGEVRGYLRSIANFRRRVALDDETIYQRFLLEINDQDFLDDLRVDLGEYPPFALAVFKVLINPAETEQQALLKFLSQVSSVKNFADVQRVLSTL